MKRKMKKINLSLLLVIFLVLLSAAYLNFSYERLNQDDYFHIKYSQVLREEGIQKELPSMKYTALHADQHFLFHVFLMPFTFGNLFLGAKIASLVFLLLLVIVLHKFFQYHKISYPYFWTLAFIFGSSFFLTRLLELRAIVFSVIYVIIATHLLIKKQKMQ